MKPCNPLASSRPLLGLLACAACHPPPDAVSAKRALTHATATSPTHEANPFVGTDGHGHTHPAASRPFGMVQVGPDTRTEGWDSCSGYHYRDRSILGFSHTHLSGTGIPDYNDILVTPTTSRPQGRALAPVPLAFDHDAEWAGPGWYSVDLRAGIGVELAATNRVGIHRYSFPHGVTPGVVFDLVHRGDHLLATDLRKTGQAEIVGRRRSRGWARDQDVYFAARFSRPITVFETGEDPAAPGESKKLRAYLGFAPSDEPLVIKVALSPVDTDGALRNLAAEAPHWDLAKYREAADQAWAETLGKIEITGGTDAQRRTFYTALYHSTLVPNLFQDVDGRYRGIDRKVHTADGFQNYTVFSLWDTYRATHPLFTILERGRTVDFIETLLAHHDQGGQLPMWELAGNYTGTMIGYHAVPVIADAWAKGIRDFDGTRALTAMVDAGNADRLGVPDYRRHGHVRSEVEHESVSKTLEYAYDDWCIATMAKDLGHEAVASTFGIRASNWRNVLDPETGFMRARAGGGFWSPFDPSEVNFHFTEANSWQYSFYVPHDVPGLIRDMGGRDAFLAKLDELFATSSDTSGRHQADITGLIGQYAHGNEPSHHAAYLYAMAGQPWKTQARVRQILDELYSDAPNGLSGNEDCGQMSSWYVLSALGFYAVAPGADRYVLGAPRFERVVLHLENSQDFVIEAPEVSSANRYVQSVTLNGAPVDRPELSHASIMSGGTLRFEMGPRPNRSWGTDGTTPYWTPPPTVRTPFIHMSATSFVKEGTVTMTAEPGATIHFTRDGRDPTPASPVYEGPLKVRETTEIRAVARRGNLASPQVAATMTQRPGNWRVTLAQNYNRQYTAGGPDGLADGLRGSAQWKAGRWQGYQGTDVEAVVDLGRTRWLTRIGAGFLQDANAWIWYPTEVEFAISQDGKRFDVIGTAKPPVGPTVMGSQADELWVNAGKRARFVRLRAKTLGTIPDWHPGKGEQAFIFVDELLVE